MEPLFFSPILFFLPEIPVVVAALVVVGLELAQRYRWQR